MDSIRKWDQVTSLLTFLIPMKRAHPLSKELSTFRVITPVFARPRVPMDAHQSIQLYNARDTIKWYSQSKTGGYQVQEVNTFQTIIHSRNQDFQDPGT